MIELVEGFWVVPEDIKVVKRISDDKCALWVTGQSAMDGFVLDYSAEDIVDLRYRAMYGEEDEDEEEEEDDE